MNQKLKWMSMVFALLFALSSPVFAKHDGGGDHGHGGGHNPNDGGTPPGWSHGEKKGWHGESTPPGFAKKKNHEGKKTGTE